MIRKILNNSFVLFVIFIVIAIIIPLPSWLLDFLILLNISLSLIILVMTMFIREALEFSVFPTVLLLTTVLRLSLNVSTTRGILSSGYAGSVIAAFGQFVMGGDAIVGFLIFIIIVLVNFIVITKGSERVSEVAARFTLDAMPGKQMAIDADLNAGIINEEEAKRRRNNIQREADFYGSMDGATKFVKGDAIMSIVTTLVNLIGGVIIGMVRGGGDFNSILNTYSLATVGDGLCSQIPALLISVATGMIVTRAASEDSLVNDIKSQFTAQPFVLMIAGIVMIVMMVIPGFPTVVCLILGVLSWRHSCSTATRRRWRSWSLPSARRRKKRRWRSSRRTTITTVTSTMCSSCSMSSLSRWSSATACCGLSMRNPAETSSSAWSYSESSSRWIWVW